MKFLKIALALAMVLCLTTSVYAETQSVKVSGDLTVRGFWRENYDGRSVVPSSDTGNAGAAATRTGLTSANDYLGLLNGVGVPAGKQNWIMSTAEVQIDAELTDNVSTVVRLLNQRDWNVTLKAYNSGTNLSPNGVGAYTPQSDAFNVNLDLAYVKLKNFIYSPLTVTVGRQDLWFGKGFVVGSNFFYDNWTSMNAANIGGGSYLNAPEYTAMTAFDSIKAVLDYDPWTISGIYSNILNGAITSSDGIDLWGVNVGYVFNQYKAEAEAYWFYKRDRTIPAYTGNGNGLNDIHTLGIRGSADPIENLTIAGELAYQCGTYTQNQVQMNPRARSAYALDFSAEYRGLMDKVMWKPKLGTEFVLYSGNNDSQFNDVQGDYTGWDPMFRGKFDSAIREFVGSFYATYDYPSRTNFSVSTPDASFTNQAQMILSGSITPIESLNIKGNFNMFWNLEAYMQNRGVIQGLGGGAVDGVGQGYIGSEVDIQTTWDYTEDVSFGLLTAWFMPGQIVYKQDNAVAQDIVATCSVSF